MQNNEAKNIFWLTTSRILALGILFLAYTQLFRYLGPFKSGQYQFVLSFVAIFSVVIDFGVSQLVIKKIAESKESTAKYFANFFIAEIIIAVTLFLILCGVALLSNHPIEVFSGILVAGLGMLVNGLTFPFLAVLSAHSDLRKVALINFLNTVVNVVVIFTAIKLEKGIVFLSTNQVIFGCLSLFLYTQFTKNYLKPGAIHAIKTKVQLSVLKPILIASLPFSLLVGFSAIYNKIDVVLIGKVLGFEATGLYTAAYKFFDLCNFFPATVSHTLYPVLAGLMAVGNLSLIKQKLEQYIRLMSFVAVPLAVFGTLLAKDIILLVAGEEFVSATQTLQILVWAIALLYIYIPVNSIIISQLTKKAVIVTLVNVVLNITGNLILLPILGIKAAAIMTVTSELLQLFAYVYLVRKHVTPFKLFGFLIRPIVGSTVMAIAILSLHTPRLILSALIGLVVYSATLIITGFLQNNEIEMIKEKVRSWGNGSA